MNDGTVVIVGGGILGTMHAVSARQRGLRVVHLERELTGRGASVRNFGLVWVSGRAPGPELDLALRARRRWAEATADVPDVGFRPAGSPALGADETELSLIKEASARPDAAARGFEVLDPAAAREVNPALVGEVAGALHCTRGAILEPRLAAAALRAHLARSPGYTWLPGREAVAVAPHAVRDHTGQWHRGDLVVVCSGAAYTGLAGPHLAAFPEPPLRRVRLQMLQTRPFPGRLTTSVADGDSLRYYPAYDVPSLASLPPQAEVAARNRAQLLLVQRLDGSLTIGDTHEYDEPFRFDVDEGAYDHLVARAAALLGGQLPRVQRRWAGVYSQVTTDELYHRSEMEPGVVLVTGPGGRGMTCSPAIAEETFA